NEQQTDKYAQFLNPFLLKMSLKSDCYPIPLVVTSLFIFATKPCKTFPGPHSVNSVAPSAIICSIVCVHFTGPVNCAIRFNFISSGSVTALATTFWYTGQNGISNLVFPIASDNSSFAGCINGE